MNLRDLQYLVTLSETRHFGRAAERVHISQPTLSGQLRKLEETLGVQLFERDSRNVRLTPAGEAILGEARSVLAHADAIRDIANSHRDPLAGTFRLGIIASLGPFLGPDLLIRVSHNAPRLDLTLHEGLTDDLLASIRARNLDAVLVATDADGPDLAMEPVFDEPFLLAHAPDHALAAVSAPTLGDIAAGTLLLLGEGHCLRDQALSLCGTAAVDDSVEATSLITLMRLAALGRGATLVPALAAHFAEGLTLRPLAGSGASRRVQLAARRNFPRRHAIEIIAETARKIALAAGLTAVAAEPAAGIG